MLLPFHRIQGLEAQASLHLLPRHRGDAFTRIEPRSVVQHRAMRVRVVTTRPSHSPPAFQHLQNARQVERLGSIGHYLPVLAVEVTDLLAEQRSANLARARRRARLSVVEASGCGRHRPTIAPLSRGTASLASLAGGSGARIKGANPHTGDPRQPDSRALLSGTADSGLRTGRRAGPSHPAPDGPVRSHRLNEAKRWMPATQRRSTGM
jgi:hypothetical protein